MELATIPERNPDNETRVILLNESAPLSKKPTRKFGMHHAFEEIFQSSKHGISHSMPYIPNNFVAGQNNGNKRILKNTMTMIVSGLYCNILVVLGMSLPIAEVLSRKVPPIFYEAFYMYLYLGSMIFLTFVNTMILRKRSKLKSQNSLECSNIDEARLRFVQANSRYGSFYLRMGAAAFGVGSMIYSALELGQYFENVKCTNFLMAFTPGIRILFIIVQLQFIFISEKEKTLAKYNIPAKFGLMHMIATNLCVWLNVLIQETKHEILSFYNPNTSSTEDYPVNVTALFGRMKRTLRSAQESYGCRRTHIMGSLVQNASPFLFPCTIEYSLICAVILYALWKHVCSTGRQKKMSTTNKVFRPGTIYTSQYFTVDCANAHKGLFASIMVMVFTITSLIMFCALIKEEEYATMAVFQVNLCELILYVITTLATIFAMYRIKDLKYETIRHLELDNILLVMAQTGLYMYFTFSLIAGYFTREIFRRPNIVITAIFGIIQSSMQTLFIIDAWWRRCTTTTAAKEKPARQLVTFLLISNIAMWAINHLENARADFHPVELHFYGVWAWTIITHLSMPLAVFYRFHSTVCLCEIWKCTYKMRLQ